MTAFKRSNRPNEGYRISPRLPKPWGRVGPWQTGLKRRAQAEQVEAWIKEMALVQPALIDMLDSGKVKLRDAWVAKLRGTLDQLLVGVNDPLLTEAVAAYRPECTDTRARQGLGQLLALADAGVRLSWLAGNNVRTIYRKALEAKDPKSRKPGTRKPNSVRRSLHRAVSELLTYHLKAAGRNVALEGVVVPGEDDTREVHVTGEELRKVLDNCGRIRTLALSAITTAIDIGPLLKMTPRHLRETDGFVDVPDTKTKDRLRKLRISDTAWAAFRAAALGKQPDERLWPWSYQTVYQDWRAAAATASRPDLRFKDLRHVLPTIMAELGVDRRSIQPYLGHARGSKQTDRYITPTGDVAVLNAASERLGLSHLKVG